MWFNLAKEYTHSPWPQRCDQDEHLKQVRPIRVEPRTLIFKFPLNSGERRTGVADSHFCHQVDSDNESNMEERGTEAWRENSLWWQSLNPLISWIFCCSNQKSPKLIQMYYSEVIYIRLFLKSETIVPLTSIIKFPLKISISIDCWKWDQ